MKIFLQWPFRLGIFMLFTFLFIAACQKDELDDFDPIATERALSETEENFFSFDYLENQNTNLLSNTKVNLRSGENGLILEEINDDIQAQNQQYNFVEGMVLEYGFPLWSRAVIDQGVNYFDYIAVIPFAHVTSTSTTANLYVSKKNNKLIYRLVDKAELNSIATNLRLTYSGINLSGDSGSTTTSTSISTNKTSTSFGTIT